MSSSKKTPKGWPSQSGVSGEKRGGLGFVERLESLRGIAAMVVSAHHASLIIPVLGWQLILVECAQNFINGRAAVTLFFVLSGLVLGLSLRRTHEAFDISILQFYLRRIFRIYPAFLICTIVIAAYLAFIYTDSPGPGGYWFERFYGSYHQPISLSQFIKNLLFRDDSLNGIAWTLRLEMECSFLLPFLHWLANRLTLRQNMLLLVMLPIIGFPLKGPGKFLYMFFAGYLLPLAGPALFAPLRQKTGTAILVLISAITALLFSRLIGENNEYLQRVGFVIECAGAVCLIGMLLFGPELKAYLCLDFAVVRFYGRISYSYYLWHYFLLFLVTRLALSIFSRNVLLGTPLFWGFNLWLVSMLIATGVAYVSYRFIEKPCIGWSKTICSKMHGRKPLVSIAKEETFISPRSTGMETKPVVES